MIRRTLEPPSPVRYFTGKGGKVKYKLIESKKATREVVIMAKATKTKKTEESTEIEDTELDELAALEDLDDLETDDDEDEDEDTDDEDEDEDEDEDDAPKKSKGKKGKGKTKTKAKAKVEKDYVGSAEVAEHFGVDARTLRMVFRKHNITKDPDSNQYRWDSLTDPTVKKIGKLIKAGAADDIKKESLDKLKTQQEAKKAAKAKEKGKKGKKGKKTKKSDDDE